MSTAAVAALSAAVLSACGAPSAAHISSTAMVTVNGNEVRPHLVRCFQLQWYRTIEVGNGDSGATVVIDQWAEPITAKSVRIRNLAGFTGMYSEGDGGSAKAGFGDSTFTVSGTAEGFNTVAPDQPATAEFRIAAHC
ncbi:putative conserved lipoprotein [Mycobacterium kansasii 732]|uniref:Putative conserved lipoprotein n=1 Tax=Mycobacterium kansasii 662 TaxID=1299326 RepID=X7ZGQ0_MYCKA|nr:lipoprotein LpqH [Mycobacterium kansasii]EUA07601.1 putative conserved lipoprotein [Mycobacterium kansasii 732]EUA17883.1 putative conserved lipoprotein [Mycobacterium kansasii 662]